MSQFFTSGGQSIGVSASTRPSNEYSGLISLGWTGWIFLQSMDSQESLERLLEEYPPAFLLLFLLLSHSNSNSSEPTE